MNIQFLLPGKEGSGKVTYPGLFESISFLKNAIILLMVLFFSFSSSTFVIAQEKCLSSIIRDQQNEKNPRVKRNREIISQQVQEYIQNNPNAREAAQVTIPVVFQVIHNGDAIGTSENLSAAQLMQQLNQLNADFARMNSDAGNTPAAFQGVAANTMIQFCLATTDPNGQPTTGIVRTNLNLDQNACWNADFITTNIVTGRAWNTANYLNIFTVLKIARDDCSSNSILGYATFPGGPAATDVAVHAYYTIGSIASPNPVNPTFGMGRTVTHEVGHWLMLEHIWFDDGCDTDDGVADTPPQDKDSNGCPTFPMTDACTSTGNGIMFMNYMDYVDDNCMNMFTQGQATRMLAAINASRPGLLNSQCGMNPMNDGYTCANAIEINAAGDYNAPGPSQGNGAIDGTHANWYKFTPPMTGMIRIYTCGLNNGGYKHFHVYDDASVCPTNTNNVQYTEDRGCGGPNDISLGVDLDSIPVISGVPIFIEWDDLSPGGNTNPFSWALEYMMGGGNTCTDYVATDVPLNIPDNNPIGVTSTINVPTGGTITDINIKNLTGTHDYLGDLTFILMSPQATSVVLIANLCDNDPNGFNITLDDQAVGALNCPLNDMATEQPASPLSVLNGQDPMGNWTLKIVDDGVSDVGTLTGWTLNICVSGGGGPCPPTLAKNEMNIASGTYQAGTQLTSSGSIGAGNNVTFRAGNNVEMQNNFSVPQTAVFQAQIGGCQ